MQEKKSGSPTFIFAVIDPLSRLGDNRFNSGEIEMRRTLIAISLMLPLNGCALWIVDHIKAGERTEQAEKDYRGCLTANVAQPQVCQPLKEVWESDKAGK